MVLVSFMTTETSAKENLMSKKVDKTIQTLASNCNRKIEYCTKDLYFFTSWTTFGLLIMAKGEGNYFLIVKYAALPKYVESTENMNILLSNGDTLKFNICGSNLDIQGGKNMSVVYHNYTNKKKPIGVINIPTSDVSYCLYEISKEGLQKIAENEMDRIIIYYNGDEKNYLEYETQRGKRKGLKRAAQMILSK